MKKENRTQKKNRRYYLHQKIKKLVKYNARDKTCFLPAASGSELTGNRWIQELKNVFGYSVQFQIS